jgi:hypothetical protein
MKMAFSDLLIKIIEEQQQRTVCEKCQGKYPELDLTKHLCIHYLDSNQFPGLLWRIIILAMTASDETKEALLKAKSEKGQPPEIKLLVDGVEIPFAPFFKVFHDQLNDMINREAQNKIKSVIQKYEEKFSDLFRETEAAAKELFPSYENQED